MLLAIRANNVDDAGLVENLVGPPLKGPTDWMVY